MAKDAEYLKIFIVHFCFFFSELPIQFITPLIEWEVRFLVFNICSSLCILDINSLPDAYLTEIFLYAVDCFITLLIVSFVQKFFHL